MKHKERKEGYWTQEGNARIVYASMQKQLTVVKSRDNKELKRRKELRQHPLNFAFQESCCFSSSLQTTGTLMEKGVISTTYYLTLNICKYGNVFNCQYLHYLISGR